MIGSGVFAVTDKEFILNLKHGYLCFPKMPLPQLAAKLGMRQTKAMYDAGRIWLDFTANGQVIKDYFLDTGATHTSLTPEDLAKLKLPVTGSTEGETVLGKYKAKTYGPVTIELGSVKKTLSSVNEAPSKEYRKIGNDYLGGRWIGISAKTQSIFF